MDRLLGFGPRNQGSIPCRPIRIKKDINSSFARFHYEKESYLISFCFNYNFFDCFCCGNTNAYE